MARPDLAGKLDQPRAQALVLGPAAVARPIADGLSGRGFEAIVAEADSRVGPIPPPAAPGAAEVLARELKAFVERSGKPLGPFAHAVHPGTSPWADRPEFVHLCQSLGLNLLSPPVRVMTLFGNTLNLLQKAEELRIPHLALSFDPIYSRREVDAVLVGGRTFPIVLKSVRPIGATSILVLRDEDDLAEKFPLWMEQVRLDAGEAIAFAERYVESARHVTLPFARFHGGSVEFFPIVEGSLQTRGHRIVEICPAPHLESRTIEQLRKWASSLLESSGFVGVGSLDFMLDGARAFLLGGLPRIGTSFRLWERVAGTSAIGWQLATLMESDTGFDAPTREESRGAAVSFRLYAEDPLLQLPQPGVITELSDRREWRIPGAIGELHLNIEQGSVVSVTQTGLLGVGTAHASDLKQALIVARGMLDEFWLAGSLRTNQKFLSELLLHPWVREGNYHASFVDEEFLPEVRPDNELLPLFACVCAELGGGWEVPHLVSDQWLKPVTGRLSWKQPPQFWALPDSQKRRGLSGVLAGADGRDLRVCVYPLSDDRWQVRIADWTAPVRRARAKVAQPEASQTPLGPQVSALVSGRIHALYFREGATAPPHEPLLLIESLRTLVPHALPRPFVIRKWHVAAEQLVTQGQLIAELEAVSETLDS